MLETRHERRMQRECDDRQAEHERARHIALQIRRVANAIQDRHARIEVGYGLEPILPDGKVGGFQREAIPLMRSGDYSQALLLVTTRVADVIAADAGSVRRSERMLRERWEAFGGDCRMAGRQLPAGCHV